MRGGAKILALFPRGDGNPSLSTTETFNVVDSRCADAKCFSPYKNQSGIFTCFTQHYRGCPSTGVCEVCRTSLDLWGEHHCWGAP